ncbi:hypothetical protein ACOI1C_13980 [Bacillus sp. DJP31]|uniref:hypothetical protein n=1 Tax=Bacillus sp. DJP31 TaxID=3409789 RepID=UPI003BB766F5
MLHWYSENYPVYVILYDAKAKGEIAYWCDNPKYIEEHSINVKEIFKIQGALNVHLAKKK